MVWACLHLSSFLSDELSEFQRYLHLCSPVPFRGRGEELSQSSLSVVCRIFSNIMFSSLEYASKFLSSVSISLACRSLFAFCKSVKVALYSFNSIYTWKRMTNKKWSICFNFGFKLLVFTVKIRNTPGIPFSFIWCRLLPWQQTIAKITIFCYFSPICFLF